MRAIISSTYDDQYLFYLPITTWVWNKLNVDVICFVPVSNWNLRTCLVWDTLVNNKLKYTIKEFEAPEHKQATYAQVSRLFGSCLDLPEDEVLITSDIDMLCFGNVFRELNDGSIHIIGYDLLDPSTKQIPMCYIAMQAKQWRHIMNIGDKSYQECLDGTIGLVESEHFRGCQWSFDQNLAFSHINGYGEPKKHSRAKMPERFATHRIDRDDMFWEERLNWDVVDYHCHRPGYTDENFEKILTVIKYFYPYDDLSWMKQYQEEYKKLV